MIDIHETIDASRRGALDLDCTKMVLRQHKEGGPRFEGRGYIRQAENGTLLFKLYVDKKENAGPAVILAMPFGGAAGTPSRDDDLYELTATSVDRMNWTAIRIAGPRPNWNMRDDTGILTGNVYSIVANDVPPPRPANYLRLHFFEEYELPLNSWSPVGTHAHEQAVRDRARFDACGSKFEIQRRTGAGDTVVEVTSDTAFPPAFDLRIQEALQYITGKTAIWRARLQSSKGMFTLELASPRPKAARTQFNPPLSPASIEFHHHGWLLFERFLTYVVENTDASSDSQLWNPVAYHLYNASESTSASIDAWAVGVSVAVEAVASLIEWPGDQEKDSRWTEFRNRALQWLEEQRDFEVCVKKRARGLIGSAASKGVQETLRELSEKGYVDKEHVKAWGKLRNRHVHPNLVDLQLPGPAKYKELFNRLQQIGMLLHQLTFHLIKYEGPFTEYGRDGVTSQQYPLSEKAVDTANRSSS